MVIYLPPANNRVEINNNTPAIIAHKRVNGKKVASFKINEYEDFGDYPYTYHSYPIFKGHPEDEARILSDYKNHSIFADFVSALISYPDAAVKNNIEGTVRVSFEIERNGVPMNFKILSGIGYGCDEEVINAIKKAGNWVPAIDNGRPIVATEIITIQFKLTNK